MMTEELIRKEIEKHKKLEEYCTKARDPQEARKHRHYKEAFGQVLES